jgi:thymidylate synthase (FAD)
MRLMDEVKVLDDYGFVRLDGGDADDLSVINSARVSYAKRHETIEAGDAGLINFLMRERHGTPFEHNSFRFHVKAPLFVTREWQRHRIGSFNEVSGRYVELPEEYYIPSLDNIRKQEGRPGQYRFVKNEDRGSCMWTASKISEAVHYSFRIYHMLLEHDVAREQARLVIPLATYTQFYWTVNARSLMNFISLRSGPTAMYEIQEYAKAIEQMFSEKMPLTHGAWNANGRVAP